MTPIDTQKPVLPPPPTHNGGWFTGEAFAKNAPYATVPVIPDAGYLTHFNLRSAQPPPLAPYQYPGGGMRPGNNYQPMPGIQPMQGPYNLWCAGKEAPACSAPSPSPAFSRYFHLSPASGC